ncbi:CCA tRNA nucleotidyltransferase [Acidaminobacter sp. JC074]|uniref:CCA tRNA nucleotidyltransferase n=1 Tax=Acidaminobacter sp. JC074 TaxID=2530199 RepID=UPI001F0E988B|nr:HD domain-containing protein [Acidaminobacter sp. JC074]
MIPNEVIYILETLERNGFQAYIVGGAVRNHLMGYPIKDWDITTNAIPDQIEALFEHTYAVGKAFGTIVVSLEDDYEVTTYRSESGYDGRKPTHVSFSSDVMEDIKRRDFTMNAMLMDKSGQILDYYKGQEDIKHNMVKTVGHARDRFTEDYLRVYRYIRFTTEYHFDKNPEIDQIIKSMPIHKGISVERIREEFNKILLSDMPSKGIKHLYDTGLLAYILPEILDSVDFDQHSEFHHLTVFDHLMATLNQTPAKLPLRLAALLHDIGKPSTFELIEGRGRFYSHDKASVNLAGKFLKRFKYDNDTCKHVEILISNHMRLLDLDNNKSVKKFMNKIGLDNLSDFLELRKADILSSTTNDSIESVESMKTKFDEIIHEKAPMSVNDLALDGHDLMKLGYKGKEIGELKLLLLDLVLDKPQMNNKESLIEHIKLLNK